MPYLKSVTASVKENVAYVNQVLPVKKSFDLVQRDMVIGGREAPFFFVDGFTKDESMLKIMDSFFGVKEDYKNEYRLLTADHFKLTANRKPTCDYRSVSYRHSENGVYSAFEI